MDKVKIKLDGGVLPMKASAFSAAYDLFCPMDYVLSHGRQVVDLMFSMELPHGKAALVQPRSGFSSKGVEVVYHLADGVTHYPHFRLDADVLIGLVDEDYRGHVGVIIDVHREISEDESFVIPAGTRLAQMRIVDVPETEMVLVDELDMSNDRGGGFGHTGAK